MWSCVQDGVLASFALNSLQHYVLALLLSLLYQKNINLPRNHTKFYQDRQKLDEGKNKNYQTPRRDFVTVRNTIYYNKKLTHIILTLSQFTPSRPSIHSQSVGYLELLRPKSLKRSILNENHDTTLGSIESLPEIELDGTADALLGCNVLHSGHLLQAADNVIVGQHAALVLAAAAVGDQAAFIESHHYVDSAAVYL